MCDDVFCKQSSSQFMRHAKRRKLTVEDFNRALRWSNVEVICNCTAMIYQLESFYVNVCAFTRPSVAMGPRMHCRFALSKKESFSLSKTGMSI